VETEDTRRLIEEYYATLPTGDRDKLASLFSDDVEWYPPESAPIGPFKGREAVTAELGGDTLKRLFQMRTFRLTVHKIVADGDTAVVQQAISASTREGKQYDNEYCWVYTCRDGRIARIVEYADTRKAAGIFDWD
jgi:ketosteroid isomerase-like protein